MARETKVGLVMAFAFVALVGGVLAYKLRFSDGPIIGADEKESEVTQAEAPPENASAAAEASAQLPAREAVTPEPGNSSAAAAPAVPAAEPASPPPVNSPPVEARNEEKPPMPNTSLNEPITPAPNAPSAPPGLARRDEPAGSPAQPRRDEPAGSPTQPERNESTGSIGEAKDGPVGSPDKPSQAPKEDLSSPMSDASPLDTAATKERQEESPQRSKDESEAAEIKEVAPAQPTRQPDPPKEIFDKPSAEPSGDPNPPSEPNPPSTAEPNPMPPMTSPMDSTPEPPKDAPLPEETGKELKRQPEERPMPDLPDPSKAAPPVPRDSREPMSLGTPISPRGTYDRSYDPPAVLGKPAAEPDAASTNRQAKPESSDLRPPAPPESDPIGPAPGDPKPPEQPNRNNEPADLPLPDPVTNVPPVPGDLGRSQPPAATGKPAPSVPHDEPKGGVPVTIEPEPTVPDSATRPAPSVVAPQPPAAPVVAPRPEPFTKPQSASPIRPVVHVESFDVETYIAQQGDTFASISRAKYRSDRYHEALALFNRERDPKLGEPQPGRPVFIPPADYLERRFSSTIPGSAGSTRPTTPYSNRQPTQSLDMNRTPIDAERPNPTSRPNRPSLLSPQPNRQGQSWNGATGEKQTSVRPGEKIWDIAKRTLGDGTRWNEIHRLNRDRVPDVNQLQEGMVLRLPADAKVDASNSPQ